MRRSRFAPFRVALSSAVVLSSLGSLACGIPTWSATVHEPGATLPGDTERRWLKVHTHSGGLYLFERWNEPANDGSIEGMGTRFDEERVALEVSRFVVPGDSIALLETNDRVVVHQFSKFGLTTYTVVMGATTVACLADPKSCFGSCPTFYETAEADRPLAEGFSRSFARVLEERDIDHLGVEAEVGSFSLVMRNEAQETHAVRHVRLLAVPVDGDERALLTPDGTLVAGRRTANPVSCRSEDGGCLDATRVRDDVEYAPSADGADLARREEVLLGFEGVPARAGVVLSARHSLVSTYVFYQSLAWAGASAGDVLAALERGEPGVRERVLGVAMELGGIEVAVREPGGEWRSVGVFDEAGPIAADRHVLPIGGLASDRLEVRLRMARGSWRIDEVGVTELGGVLEPVVLEPDSVDVLHGADRDPIGRLADPEGHLVTAQGDAHEIWFTVPEGGSWELFLDTEGYYYEWMRDEWLAEQDPLRAAAVLGRPREALRAMAPGFKEVEPEMERLFWASRFRR